MEELGDHRHHHEGKAVITIHLHDFGLSDHLLIMANSLSKTSKPLDAIRCRDTTRHAVPCLSCGYARRMSQVETLK